MMHVADPVRPVRELNPAVSEELDRILGLMLAKDPAERYETPEQAAHTLEEYLGADSRGAPEQVDPQEQAYLDWVDSQPEAEFELVEVPDPDAADELDDEELEVLPADEPEEEADEKAGKQKPRRGNSGKTIVIIVVIVVLVLFLVCGVGTALLAWFTR
jgi:hypothetical protein